MNRLKKRLTLAAATLLLSGAQLSLAQAPDIVVNTFDVADEASAWARWWGAAMQTYEFDPGADAGNNSNSGSLKGTIEFDRAGNGGDNQFAVIGNITGGPIDATKYTNLVFDLRWDAASPQRPWGDFGSLEFGFRKSDFSQAWLTPTSPMNVPLTPTNGWIRVVAPINPGAPGIDRVTGIVFKMWSGDPTWGQTGTATFWIDNVKLIANTNTAVPRPTISIAKAAPGLRVFASAAGSQYQRQNIRTVNNAYSWVNATAPVTYSFTLAEYPGATNPGFQTHIFLVPGSGIANWESSPDWNQPNIVFLDIQNNASGAASASFRYKTNQANGNTMIYNGNPANGPVGTLASIGSSNMLGTWSLTFSNNTNVTITTPVGTSTNFVFPAASAELFADPLYAYFGIQPNRPENINQSAHFTRVQISGGVAEPINETFAGVAPDETTPVNLDPAIWERVAESPAGVVLIPTNIVYGITWTVPANGFVLQSSSQLRPGTWTDSNLPATQIGDRFRVWVPSSAIQPAAFFRLFRP